MDIRLAMTCDCQMRRMPCGNANVWKCRSEHDTSQYTAQHTAHSAASMWTRELENHESSRMRLGDRGHPTSSGSIDSSPPPGVTSSIRRFSEAMATRTAISRAQCSSSFDDDTGIPGDTCIVGYEHRNGDAAATRKQRRVFKQHTHTHSLVFTLVRRFIQVEGGGGSRTAHGNRSCVHLHRLHLNRVSWRHWLLRQR